LLRCRGSGAQWLMAVESATVYGNCGPVDYGCLMVSLGDPILSGGVGRPAPRLRQTGRCARAAPDGGGMLGWDGGYVVIAARPATRPGGVLPPQVLGPTLLPSPPTPVPCM